MNEVTRRCTLSVSFMALAVTCVAPFAVSAADDMTLAISMRSLSNPYHATFAKGGEAFAESVGLPFEVLVTEGNSEKGLADIRALMARTNGNVCINVDPNDSPDAKTIVEEAKKAGAFVVTQWNKPDDLHPWDNNPNYVAHMSFSGVGTSKEITNALIDAMGGEGGIVALGGILSNVPAIERKKGMEEAVAETGGKVKILDFQPADWNETKAFEIMQAWLTRYGDEIKGVWAANDSMGIGALEALRQEGKAGAVPVVGIDGTDSALAAVEAGEMAGTVAWDPTWTGGMGLSLCHAAATGKIDIAKEPNAHREFYGTGIVVTPDNIKAFKARDASFDYNDYWAKSTGQIQYQ